ncbi:tetratricopeptide repeat protein [Stieleria varia]|uniref:tetratricopeptide repeat protein n=1 Tax=Stieleria varia TaxID=2528005 RepID=UPI0011B4CAF4|nr:tetratricopeptide repeat protein [Stieleria varia]
MKTAEKPGRPTLSLRKKLAFTCGVTLAFFCILEIGLAAIGFREPATVRDPLVGFSGHVPLMIPSQDDQGRPVMRTAPGKLTWFNDQHFFLPKPPDVKRVVCLGGSTTYGRPFDDHISFSNWLRQLLPVTDSDHRWEVINAGGISYASYRVAAVMEELAEYQPDLYIVYTGQNEFLEQRTYAGLMNASQWSRDSRAWIQSTRTWGLASSIARAFHDESSQHDASGDASEELPAEVDERLNHTIGPQDYERDDAWHDKVCQDYQWNLQRMIEIARAADVPIVFVMPTSNELDCSPFKSEPSNDLSSGLQVQLKEAVALSQQSVDARQWQEALDSSRLALELDDRNPDACFLAGIALHHLGRQDEALASLTAAVDNDICPLRATSRLRGILREVTQRYQVPLVDFERRLRQTSQDQWGHPCLGSRYFLDHVHPDPATHRRLAGWILESLIENSLVRGELPSQEDIDSIDERIQAEIDTTARAVSYRNLAKVLHWSGKFREALPRARDAVADMPDDLESRYIAANCLQELGQWDEAVQEYDALFARGDFDRAVLPFGELLYQRGEMVAAKAYVMQASVVTQGVTRARAFFFLGRIHQNLGENEFAIESLRKSDELYPNHLPTLLALAGVLMDSSQFKDALAVVSTAAEQNPDSFEAHWMQGRIHIALGETSKAAAALRIADQIRPGDPEIQQTLELLN